VFELKAVPIVLTLFLATNSWATEGFADPTRPPDYRTPVITKRPAKLPEMVLSSIVISPQRRVAIIDGQAVREGATHRGMRVIAIDSNRVRLRGTAGSITLTLLPTAIKRAVRKVEE